MGLEAKVLEKITKRDEKSVILEKIYDFTCTCRIFFVPLPAEMCKDIKQ